MRFAKMVLEKFSCLSSELGSNYQQLVTGYIKVVLHWEWHPF